MATVEDDAPSGRPLVRDYTILTLTSLAIVFLLLFAEGPGLWSLIPIAIALIGLLGRWSSGPAFFLLAFTVLIMLGNLFVGQPLWSRPQATPLIDVLLAAGILAYTASHMRLLTLLNHGVPPDRRRKRKPMGGRVVGRWLLPGESARRTTKTGLSGEAAVLLVSVPVYAIVAGLLWVALSVEVSPVERFLPNGAWQFFVAMWAMGIGLLGLHALLGYLGRAYASREESLLFLQDQLWTKTRGEQRRIWRWLTWRRLKRQAKEER